ncbi:HAD-IIIC family phosphatase, partial [Campylobacter coli]|nr:HAD-IIIC family phosphatase [Campylobacter coli]
IIYPYLFYSKINADFIYSNYDDSFSFNELDQEADMLIFWVDLDRYKENAINFVLQRLEVLQKQYHKPILLVPTMSSELFSNRRFYYCSLEDIKDCLEGDFFDKRLEKFTGTSLSDKACLKIAKKIGLKYIPALLRPNLKAIVVDLDNTLYQGVLGEDGINGIVLTPGHRRLQEMLKEKKQEGYFLSIASKNNLDDVQKLFTFRDDFPLQMDDFSYVMANWECKANSIQKIISKLNINVDSVLFIDDNASEILSVLSVFDTCNFILASEDANKTCDILADYPRLLKLRTNIEDSIRQKDILANEMREQIKKTMSNEEYLKSLEICITYNFNNKNQTSRISELANKTNQFIFNYKRYSENEILSRMEDDRYIVASVELKDKLSNSGIIGVCVGYIEEQVLTLEECFVSCRALGRGLDDLIILGCIEKMMKKANVFKLKVLFSKGERNLPAEKFIQEKLQDYTIKPYIFSYNHISDFVKVTIIGD